MRHNFDNITSLFKPNYNVYKPSLNISEPESKNSESVRVIYDPDNVERIKSIIIDMPQDNDPLVDSEHEVADEHVVDNEHDIEKQMVYILPQSDQEFFMQELEKFIAQNPKYKDLKDSLSHLAALESNYKLSIENKQGSGALGWFQFMDSTRRAYNTQTREEFAQDPQAQLLAAAQHYTKLQQEIRKRGGDPDDFVTMYGAWWRPASAYQYLKDPNYDITTKYSENFQKIRQRARNFVQNYGKSNS